MIVLDTDSRIGVLRRRKFQVNRYPCPARIFVDSGGSEAQADRKVIAGLRLAYGAGQPCERNRYGYDRDYHELFHSHKRGIPY